MRTHYLVILLILSTNWTYSNDGIYPFKLEIGEFYQSSELISNAEGDSTSVIFQIKSDFAEANEMISVLKGDTKTESQKITLQNRRILNKMLIDEHLYMLTMSDFQFSLVIMNSNLEFNVYPFFDLRVGLSTQIDSKILGKIEDDVVIMFSGRLYRFNVGLNSLTKIESESDFTQSFILSPNVQNIEIVGLVKERNSADAVYIQGKEMLLSRNKFVSFDENMVINNNQNLYFISSEKSSNQTFVQSIDFESFSALAAFWVNAPLRLLHFDVNDINPRMSYVVSQTDKYEFVISTINASNNLSEISRIELPSKMLFPRALMKSFDSYVVLFANGIVMLDSDGQIISVSTFNIKFPENEKLRLYDYGEHFIISSNSISVSFNFEENDLWLINRIIEGVKEYLVACLFIFTLIVFVQLYRHQRRLFREMIDLPGIGFMTFIDKNGRLILYNALASNILGITKVMPKKKYFEFYFKNESYKEIASLLKSSFESRSNLTERINIDIGTDSREWVCKTIVLRNIAGRFRGVFFTGVDITEQLQRKRISNWAQIAHDMQTNLSTIKLNAEQIECDNFPDIVKKKTRILHQVKLLIHRVRDIVTVGRSDKVDYSKHDINVICNEVLSEFDDTMFPNVTIENHSPSIMFYCDKAKIIRAIRNAIENSIKATDNRNGLIQINAMRKNANVEITIKDNGKGMTPETLAKMMIPYFTTGRKTGGSGIGTMIMQHVVELHGGKLEINSEIGVGTECRFIFPIIPPKTSIKLHERAE
ncbi:MAG: HAMP domain-containing histidine kinase [Desulfobulbaceae bacterium]|nr:HAMP domain-containing histidine kinase [Desulfobulbaceae bacterium]